MLRRCFRLEGQQCLPFEQISQNEYQVIQHLLFVAYERSVLGCHLFSLVVGDSNRFETKKMYIFQRFLDENAIFEACLKWNNVYFKYLFDCVLQYDLQLILKNVSRGLSKHVGKHRMIMNDNYQYINVNPRENFHDQYETIMHHTKDGKCDGSAARITATVSVNSGPQTKKKAQYDLQSAQVCMLASRFVLCFVFSTFFSFFASLWCVI